jgi:hypothetical protein
MMVFVEKKLLAATAYNSENNLKHLDKIKVFISCANGLFCMNCHKSELLQAEAVILCYHCIYRSFTCSNYIPKSILCPIIKMQ